MLVLTRKTNETILIGDDIEITVIRISANTTKLGIIAPKTTNIVRKEIRPESETTRGAIG